MRTPHWVVPALVVLFAVLGIGGARLLDIPSVVRDFAPAGSGPLRTTSETGGVVSLERAVSSVCTTLDSSENQ